MKQLNNECIEFQMSLLDDNIEKLKKMPLKSKKDNVRAISIALEIVKFLSKLIDENNIDKKMKIEITEKVFNSIGIELSLKNQKLEPLRKNKFSVEKYNCVDIVNKMLDDGLSYKCIADNLNKKGIKIGLSSIHRYNSYRRKNGNITSGEGGNI